MSEEQKKSSWFGKIDGRDGAIELAKGCGTAFLVVAALQAALSFIIGYSVLIDAALYAFCGYFIRNKHSRVAAVVALLLALIALVVTFINKAGQNLGGGNNVFIALIVAWAGVRAVEATFKLHGKLSAQASVAERA
ncbi:surface polysaccharide O-acyltransferase-like enzyme [Lysobacter niastensis]|uniref:Surface polysaccharide O-acyltransferase-like enzyme n=1 Tax=Lysobacter niastensis TaxID=380629 RepID=A0ABU1WAA7_9GAMM|nr:hypothetical protein [Lysobacter niastensis]MDR7134561.1 surface polysaccharide O-acyltransferase-like enzyme [Lysobacter niastensis]